jgi:type I restriction enzyme M protein
MLSNPPYGKSWKGDLERMGGKGGIKDGRFLIEHGGDPEFSLITRSSDGQMLFLANLISKMKSGTALGSRIAEVHNGSSLFTGDAGQGESNIRRWIIENDLLEAIVALPLNMFYNTGIATYIWVLSNRKPDHRKGKVQLIDATAWFKPLRKNLGKKNCELSEEDIQRIVDTFLGFEETEESKIFPNQAFGYWKVTVDRPLRLSIHSDAEHLATLAEEAVKAGEGGLESVVEAVDEVMGEGPHLDANQWLELAERVAKGQGLRWTAKKSKLLITFLGEREESAAPLIAKVFKPGKQAADPLRGFFPVELEEGERVVQYEPDPELRDGEQVPLLEEGGIEAFLQREVLPYAAGAWFDHGSVKTGYEVSFTRYFYKPKPLRTLEEIRADILALEQETEGLLGEIVGGAR